MWIEIKSIIKLNALKFHSLLRFDRFAIKVNWLSASISLIFSEYSMKL